MIKANKKYRTPTHITWSCMIQRCYDSNRPKWKHYGGRGIEVCKRWRDSFDAFLEDMGERPSRKHTIDRIDNDGDYCPENCRWATPKRQSRNRSVSFLVTAFGETKCLQEWADEYGIKRDTLRMRLLRGVEAEDAILTPPRTLSAKP